MNEYLWLRIDHENVLFDTMHSNIYLIEKVHFLS
jgi:hypothetical protein